MLKIGITGGIGSGKSIVSKIFESLNFPVFNADSVSKDIVGSDPDVKRDLIALFGEKMFEGGELNKTFLAEIIFSDDAARAKVNAIIHPKVRSAFEEFAKESSAEIVFNEAAILFETGGYKELDKVILVVAPEELRIKRVMQRDGATEAEVKARMSKQWSDSQKEALTDFIVMNDEKQPLLAQVEKVLAELTS